MTFVTVTPPGKNLLYRSGYQRAEVNAIANFTFLTQETNLKISNHDPAQYLEEFVTKQPGAVESHWIPITALPQNTLTMAASPGAGGRVFDVSSERIRIPLSRTVLENMA